MCDALTIQKLEPIDDLPLSEKQDGKRDFKQNLV